MWLNSRVLLALTLLAMNLSVSVSRADFVSPLETDLDSVQARFDVLRDPNLKEISFSTYTLRNDHIGSMFMSMLIEASRRGVHVRGIVDNDVADKTPELMTLLNEAGVQLRYYHPKTLKPLKLLNPVKFLQNMDRRLHDKLFIATFADGHRALLQGDKNYDDIYFAKTGLFEVSKKSYQGREIFIEGATAVEALKYFDFIWSSEHVDIRKPKSPKSLVTLQAERDRLQAFSRWVNTYVRAGNWRKNRTHVEKIDFLTDDFDSEGRRVRSTLAKVFDLIQNSPPNSKIEIENCFLVLNPTMERAFKTALAKGSHIRIITNSNRSNDQKLVSAALKIDLQKYRKMGIEIYFTDLDNAIHSKLVAINDTLIIMSANLDPRSLKINSESGVVLRDEKLAAQYRRFFDENAVESNLILDKGMFVSTTPASKPFSFLRPDQPLGSLLQRVLIALIRGQL